MYRNRWRSATWLCGLPGNGPVAVAKSRMDGAPVQAGEGLPMPWGVRLFLAYALVILAVIALTLPRIVDLATNIPISPMGVVGMGLLAYTIFTVTLVLQRKEAARNLALGLATL